MIKWFRGFLLETLVSIGLVIIFSLGLIAISKGCNGQGIHKIFKYSTFYAAINGGTSLGN